VLTIDEIREAIQDRHHEPAAFEPDFRQAAVAMILSDGGGDLDVCFIRRAVRPGDPWSGQVAFPGGRAGPGDRDAHAVAERETWEEIGLKLAAHHRIGPLPVCPIEPRPPRSGMTLSPFVYYVDAGARAVATVRLRHEVADVFWVPLPHLFDEAATTQLEYSLGGAPTMFPGIRFGDHIIWGLTLRVLDSFAQIMRRTLPASN
jgi:8-oxo-dGTP pyrophosphatase MutT (NUDIX family)